MTDLGQCSEFVWDNWNRHRCNNRGKVSRGDKIYCTIHDPEYIARKSAIRSARYDVKWKKRRKELAADDMYEALKSIGKDGKVKAIFWKLRHEAIAKAEGK